MKVYVYEHGRAESFVQPLVRRLNARGWMAMDWREADICICASDRREAMRWVLDAYEAKRTLWSWGLGVRCLGDHWHYDGAYRRIIWDISDRAWTMGEPDLKGYSSGDLGPPHVDDLPDTSARPWPAPYCLLCLNPLPWGMEGVPRPPMGMDAWAMLPGDDPGWREMKDAIVCAGWKMLKHLPRPEFLRWVRHAKVVMGNSSLLCYEAPIWHPSEEIVQIGLRNNGRPIIRWDVATQGSPSDNMMRQLEAFA